MTPDNLREAVAHLVDPEAFGVTFPNRYKARQRDALAKADAILSLPALSVPEGWVAVPREVVEGAQHAVSVLQMLTEPEAIRSTTVLSVWGQAVAAEAKLRNALSAIPSPGGEGNV